MKEPTETDNLIKRLTESIAFAEKFGEDMDNASWTLQEGILLTYNEAKLIVEELKSVKCD
jgi:hypothetical protein